MTSTAPLPNMMIVVGDPYTSYLIQTFAGACGYHPLTPNGKDILASAREGDLAAVVLDTDLHGEMGWEMLRSLAASGVPVLACSWPDGEARSLAGGADGHLRKPVRYDDFAAALAEVGLAPAGIRHRVLRGGDGDRKQTSRQG